MIIACSSNDFTAIAQGQRTAFLLDSTNLTFERGDRLRIVNTDSEDAVTVLVTDVVACAKDNLC